MARKTRLKKPKMNSMDRLVSWFSPRQGMQRARYRQVEALISGYSSADSGNSFNRDRKNKSGSADDHLDQRTLCELREISYDLDRNNGLFQSINDRVCENVLGPKGFILKPNSDDKDLNNRISDDWKEWMVNADYRGERHFWQMMSILYRGKKIAGDHFIETIDQEEQLNTFEADRVLTPFKKGRGAARIQNMKIINGIARNRRGIPKWYFVSKNNPKFGFISAKDGRAIPANRILHFYNPKRDSQTRGVPDAAPIIREIDDIDDLLTYNRIGAKLVAAQGFFIKTEDPSGLAEFMEGEELVKRNGEEKIQDVDPMSINYLRPGEDVVSVESNRPGNGFIEFVELLNRYCGLPYGLPLELVLLDFSKVNFASSRQLLNQAQRRFRIEQNNFALFLSRIYRWWLNLQIQKGRYSEIETIQKHYWSLPGWPSPNPLHDAQASRLAIEWGFGSRTNYLNQQGVDVDQIFDELLEEQTGLEDRDLVLLAMERIQATQMNSEKKSSSAKKGKV